MSKQKPKEASGRSSGFVDKRALHIGGTELPNGNTRHYTPMGEVAFETSPEAGPVALSGLGAGVQGGASGPISLGADPTDPYSGAHNRSTPHQMFVPNKK